MKEKKKSGGMKTALQKIFKYFDSNKVIIIIALIFSALGAVLTIVGPKQLGKITALIRDGIKGQMDLSAISKVGIVLVVIYLLSALFTFLQHYIMSVVTLKTSKRMRKDLSAKINKVPQKYFNQVSQGDVLSRITNDVSTLQQALANSLPGIISAIAQFLGCLLMMYITQPILATSVVGITLLGIVVMFGVVGRSQKYFIARQQSLGSLNGYIEEMYSGHSVVRISRADGKIRKGFDGLNTAVYDANWKSQFFSGMMQPIMTITGNLSYVLVCVIGSLLAINNVIDFPIIVEFIFYAKLFSTPLNQIAQGFTNMQTACASANRIFDFLESEELEDESSKKESLPLVKGGVEFKNVHFSYPDKPDKTIINDFSIKINPGQHVAIVGPTGAGKTTLVNLLMRFFEINEGQILIDGVPTTDIKREGIHDLFSMVLQDTWLFEGSVRENLVYNLQGVRDEDLDRVCKACGIDKFVHSLPHGYDTILSENTAVSAGQKQLFTIARAMLQNSPMLILDEATSSVDTRTELIIQKAMDKLTEGRTSFIIAHRLSTIKNADIILVLKDGDIVESGNHQTLMERGGVYAELYNSQFDTNF